MLSLEGEPPAGNAGDRVSVELTVVLIGSILTSVIESAGSLPQKHYGASAFKLANTNHQLLLLPLFLLLACGLRWLVKFQFRSFRRDPFCQIGHS
jgi:hypothetical protein